MLGEGDIFRTVLQPFVLYHFYDALYGSCFLFGGLVGFQFEDKAGFQAFCLVQILLQGRELFAVVQLYGGAYLGCGILHSHAFKGGVMIDNQLIVCGEPNVELGAVAVDRISLYKCGKGVLSRTVCSPETTVGNDFLGLDSAACSKEQGGSKK